MRLRGCVKLARLTECFNVFALRNTARIVGNRQHANTPGCRFNVFSVWFYDVLSGLASIPVIAAFIPVEDAAMLAV